MMLEEKIKELLEQKDFASIRLLLEDENVVDIAELFEELSKEESVVFFRLLPKNIAADVLPICLSKLNRC